MILDRLNARHCERSEATQSRANRTGLLRRLRLLAMTGVGTRNEGGVSNDSGGQPMKRPAVYIMASKRNGTLYTGVTSDLPARVWQHREGVADGFTKRYGCKMLVWFEMHAAMEWAIMREKQIKGGSRAKKLALIESGNPEWMDLFDRVAHA